MVLSDGTIGVLAATCAQCSAAQFSADQSGGGSNSMQDPALSRNVDHLLQALRLCRSNELYVPALLIAYAGVDILAALDPPAPDATTRDRFIAWVDAYFLPSASLPCSALDLYAARCAVVHTFGPESDLATQGKARRLLYAFGDSSAESMQATINKIGMPDLDLAIHVDTILNAFERSVWVFRKAVTADANLRARVERNSRKFFSAVSHGHSFGFLNIRMA